jgi:hypothetical protein
MAQGVCRSTHSPPGAQDRDHAMSRIRGVLGARSMPVRRCNCRANSEMKFARGRQTGAIVEMRGGVRDNVDRNAQDLEHGLPRPVPSSRGDDKGEAQVESANGRGEHEDEGAFHLLPLRHAAPVSSAGRASAGRRCAYRKTKRRFGWRSVVAAALDGCMIERPRAP